jgi:hypothetical protein
VKAHPIDRHPGPLARRASFDVANFRSCRARDGHQISPGNRSGGGRHRRRGHAATAWRSARVALGAVRAGRAGRGSRWARWARVSDPDPLPDRQVSRAHLTPRFQRCSCLLSLIQTKETYRSSIWAGSGDPRPARVRTWVGSGDPRPARVRTWGGVRRPAPSASSYLGRRQETAPSASSCLGRGQETRAQRGRVPGWRSTNNCATSKRARRVGVAPRDALAKDRGNCDRKCWFSASDDRIRLPPLIPAVGRPEKTSESLSLS